MVFKDLKFMPHPLTPHSAERAVVEFANGYGASVVRVRDGEDWRCYELVVLAHRHICGTTPITSDPLGDQSEEQITALLARIEALPPAPKD